uniref:Uncharacterized protein n=1 Tax=Anguilla anguilla TaxID=7936 RepID=A0A0E9X7F3_ANGAN
MVSAEGKLQFSFSSWALQFSVTQKNPLSQVAFTLTIQSGLEWLPLLLSPLLLNESSQ